MNEGQVIAELYTAIKKLQNDNQKLIELVKQKDQLIESLKKEIEDNKETD